MPEPLFKLNSVSYAYTQNISAIQNLTLSINQGERIAVIGANGTGKSTLLTILDALIFPTSGTLSFQGETITEERMNEGKFQKAFRKKVGFVFQNPDIQLFCPTVKEDILFGPLHLGATKAELNQRLDFVVNLMKLDHLLDRSPHHLSIGEKKKVAIASTLAIEPEVLILDEPTAGLDPQTMRDVIQVLYDMHQNGKTIIMATHDLHIVEEIADTVHVFGSNRSIIRSGSPEEILSDSKFLQDNNLVHIHVHRHPHGPHLHSH